MGVVKCIFGTEAQEIMGLIDPEWCKEHCEARDAYDRRERASDCFWHFKRFKVDLNKRARV